MGIVRVQSNQGNRGDEPRILQIYNIIFSGTATPKLKI